MMGQDPAYAAGYAQAKADAAVMYGVDGGPHEPHRGSDVEVWIKRARDECGSSTDDAWRVLDSLLDDYRLHADTGTALADEVEGPHGADS